MTAQTALTPTYMARMMFKISSVTTRDDGSKEIILTPQPGTLAVIDKRFPTATRSGPLQLFIASETGPDAFTMGATFYLDFTSC